MDYSFTEQEEALRQEIRDFAKKELPPDWINFYLFSQVDWEFDKAITKKLAAKKWIARSWPEEYGGAGASAFENMVFADETAYWGIPCATGMAVSIMGPMIMHFGTEEQKNKFLPPVIAGEEEGVFFLGYSEPDAGTDLANIRTRAVRSGDEYIINGSKIWSSFAHRARWGWMLVSTSPEKRHKGMSLMIVDLKQPGVTIRPLTGMGGWHVVNEVFLDDVRCPVTNLIGEEDRGWYLVMAALDYERAMVANPGTGRRILDELVAYCKETPYNGKPLSKDPIIRQKLANLAIDIDIISMICYKNAWAGTQGLLAPHEASIAKIFSSESSQRLGNTAMEILGIYSTLRPGSKWARMHGLLNEMYNTSFIIKFAGGTNEIQRNIVAWMGLGLPKEPRK